MGPMTNPCLSRIVIERECVLELAPPREVDGGLYTWVLRNLVVSGQMLRFGTAQGFAAVGVGTILEKIEMFWAFWRGEVADLYSKGTATDLSVLVVDPR